MYAHRTAWILMTAPSNSQGKIEAFWEQNTKNQRQITDVYIDTI